MLLNIFRNCTLIVPMISAMLVLLLRKESAEKTAYLGTKDTMISLKMADLLNIKGSAIVIPTNTTFDTIMSGDFISEKSIQGQFQKKMYLFPPGQIHTVKKIMKKDLFCLLYTSIH